MRAVVQRVSQASVSIEKKTAGKITMGLLVFLGVGKNDTQKDADTLANKIAGLRIFPDHNELMNKSLLDVGAEMLVISQFTLYGDCRKGRRPSYNDAAPPETAKALYEYFIQQSKQLGIVVQSGIFQAMMQVDLTNEGPVTILIDTKKDF